VDRDRGRRQGVMMMTAIADSFLADAERIAALHASGDPEWLTRARRNAIERFERLGFPTTRDEEWRFTSVAPIAEGRFQLSRDGEASVVPTLDQIATLEWDGARSATLVFVDGRFAEASSTIGPLPADTRVGSLARALADAPRDLEPHLTRVADNPRHAFTALNTAFLADGALVSVPSDTIVSAPIHVLFLSTGAPQPTMAHPRVLVVMGANSEATVVESYAALTPNRYLTNAVTEIVAGENATLHHYKIQRESALGFHIGSMYIRAARDASVSGQSVSLGGALVRNEVNVVLDGEGSSCTLNGLYVSDAARFIDNHTTIDHARPHCASREVYKGILAGRARAVFNGKIIVRPDAQKTDAKQTNKALLLSEEAQINTKPELEIFANDVKCTHGAAVGQMDEEAIFYLRARGLGEGEARQLLVRAFAADVLNQMPLAPLRERIEDELIRQLAGWQP